MTPRKFFIGRAIGFIIVIVLVLFYFFYTSHNNVTTENSTNNTTVIYKNTEYGFNFSLPLDWKGYSIVQNTWQGFALKNTEAQSGPKLLIRNPKWTESAPYEDLPILIFTISQWDKYIAEDFTVSAAPIPASELARNNMYVFALPPRWDYDFSEGYQQAENIISGKPLNPFNL